jgi:hypothetical protein
METERVDMSFVPIIKKINSNGGKKIIGKHARRAPGPTRQRLGTLRITQTDGRPSIPCTTTAAFTVLIDGRRRVVIAAVANMNEQPHGMSIHPTRGH